MNLGRQPSHARGAVVALTTHAGVAAVCEWGCRALAKHRSEQTTLGKARLRGCGRSGAAVVAALTTQRGRGGRVRVGLQGAAQYCSQRRGWARPPAWLRALRRRGGRRAHHPRGRGGRVRVGLQGAAQYCSQRRGWQGPPAWALRRRGGGTRGGANALQLAPSNTQKTQMELVTTVGAFFSSRNSATADFLKGVAGDMRLHVATRLCS